MGTLDIRYWDGGFIGDGVIRIRCVFLLEGDSREKWLI